MSTLLSLAGRLRNDRNGATAIEYGLLAALIAVVLIGIVATMGRSIDALYPRLAAYMTGDADPEAE